MVNVLWVVVFWISFVVDREAFRSFIKPSTLMVEFVGGEAHLNEGFGADSNVGSLCMTIASLRSDCLYKLFMRLIAYDHREITPELRCCRFSF